MRKTFVSGSCEDSWSSVTLDYMVDTPLQLIAKFFLFLLFLDFAIVALSLAQIGLEGTTGYWAPFWRVQAEWIINFLCAFLQK